MATPKKHDDQLATAPELAPAAESDDAAVRFRLAELEAARARGDVVAAQQAIDILAELGFQAP